MKTTRKSTSFTAGNRKRKAVAKTLSIALASIMLVMAMVSLSPYIHLANGNPVYSNASTGAVVVQQNNGGCQETNSPTTNLCYSVAVTFSSNVAAGDVIVVGIAIFQNSAWDTLNLSSIGDSQSLTYTEATHACDTSQPDCSFIYYASVTTSGSDTITASLSGASFPAVSAADVNIYEVSGVSTSGVGTAMGTGLSSSPSTSTSLTFSSGSFLLGVVAENSKAALTQGTGFTVSSSSTSYGYAQYSVSGVSSPTNFGGSLASLAAWAETGLVLPPAASTTTTTSSTTTIPSVPEFPLLQLSLPLLFLAGVTLYLFVRRKVPK